MAIIVISLLHDYFTKGHPEGSYGHPSVNSLERADSCGTSTKSLTQKCPASYRRLLPQETLHCRFIPELSFSFVCLDLVLFAESGPLKVCLSRDPLTL